VSCHGAADGQVSASAIGGNGGFTYSWQGLGSGAVKSNLSGGVYQVTATDNTGCTAVTAATVAEPTAISVNLSVFNASCASETGSAIVSPSGGAGGFSVSWSNGVNGNSNGDLLPGNYSVSVSDASNCQVQSAFTISSVNGLSVNAAAEPVSCPGMDDGSATALVNGGQAPYSFVWSNGNATQSISGLSAGTYTVAVSDANGCSGETVAIVAEPAPMIGMAAMLNAESCNGNDGSASAVVIGGTAPYTFIWDNGSEGNLCFGLSAGTHSVSVYDANGCSIETSVNIANACNELPEGPSLTANDCSAVNLGMDDYITCEAVEGATMYLWRFESPAAGLLTEEYSIGGNNTFWLQSVAGLIYGITVEVRVKALVNEEWTAYGQACFISMGNQVPSTALVADDCGSSMLTDGSVINCDPVLGADEYEWSFINSMLPSPIVLTSYVQFVGLNLESGFQEGDSYEVSVRARIGEDWGEPGAVCDITFARALGIDDPSAQASLLIFPNPSNGSTISLQAWNLLDQSSVSEIEIYDSNGRVVEKFALNHPGRSSFRTEHQFAERLSAGMYFLKYSLNDRLCEQKMIVR
jgi:hypothetical protein